MSATTTAPTKNGNNYFFHHGSAPACEVIDGHTVVMWDRHIHLSFKCHKQSATACSCTVKHPTHHATGCKQLVAVKTHSFAGGC